MDPATAARTRLVGRPAQWVGRTEELAVFQRAAQALGDGEGSVIWVEGEPGIGKSSLVAEALMAGNQPDWDLGWGMADQLTERLPLHAMLDCLEVRPGSADPRRAAAADLLRSRWLGPFAESDMSTTGVEVLITLVDELCAAAPTVLVLDDLQWADDASLIVWHQLATNIDRLRLLLIGTCRPVPHRPAVQQVRAAARRGGTVITIGPLPETDVAAMVGAMVGAPPGNTLRELTAQAAGNPLYVRELVDALSREQALRISETAEVTTPGDRLPRSLAAVLNDRLSSVPAATAHTLRTAALLGGRFTVTDLAVVLRRPVSELAPSLNEAMAAGILAGSGAELAFRAPELAARLLRRELEESPSDEPTRDGLMVGLGQALLASGSYGAAAEHVGRALTVIRDPAPRGQLSWMLARAQTSTGDNRDAITTIGRALESAGLPAVWRARMLALLSMLYRSAAASSTARQAREFTKRTGTPDGATWANAAVLRYWLGHWDEALAELPPLDETYADAYLRERWPALQSHGVAALISGRRDQRTTAAGQLRRGMALPIRTITDRENVDFLVAAHAVALEQQGEIRQAMTRLASLLPRRDGEMTLVHQWLPDLVRLALAVDDRRMAEFATRACADEATAETPPARAAAASLRCRGLLESDPDPLRAVVEHYRATGPRAQLPAALEDLAVVLATRGQEEEARSGLNEAVGHYDQMQAQWDVRRAMNRLRPYGVRRGSRGPRARRAASGWDALTETEVKIAALIARGDSTSDIAAGMFLSRRTVQTYISRILAKLGAKSRVEIVREALAHDAAP
jgi:DNA-binding CsgD family transcriptional regulator